MENQHKLIKGYRDLSQTEIDQMNAIKAKGEELRQLCEEVMKLAGEDAEARRWAALGRTKLQEGVMALTRSVARPGSF